MISGPGKTARPGEDSLVALTATGKPLSKAPDGGYYEIVRVTEDGTESGLHQGPETSVLVEQKVRPEAFPSGLPMSVWSKLMQYVGRDTISFNRIELQFFLHLNRLCGKDDGNGHVGGFYETQGPGGHCDRRFRRDGDQFLQSPLE